MSACNREPSRALSQLGRVGVPTIQDTPVRDYRARFSVARFADRRRLAPHVRRARRPGTRSDEVRSGTRLTSERTWVVPGSGDRAGARIAVPTHRRQPVSILALRTAAMTS